MEEVNSVLYFQVLVNSVPAGFFQKSRGLKKEGPVVSVFVHSGYGGSESGN